MTNIALGLAFVQYLANPCAETVEAVVVALEASPRPDITPEQTRAALLASIDEVKRQTADMPMTQAAELLNGLSKLSK